MQVDPTDDNPQEEIVEEDDLDLDLSDLHGEPADRETVRERLQRAAKRRTTKQQEELARYAGQRHAVRTP